MSTPRPPAADGLATRDLDRHLLNRAGILVDAATLADLPQDHLSGAAPILLAAGAPSPTTVPAPLLRLLMRAGSMAVPCALVTERLGLNLTGMLTTLRVPNVWTHAVSATEHREQGTNPYRAAALALRLPVQSCLIVTTDPASPEAKASGARRLLLSRAGTLSLSTGAATGLSHREHAVALLLALGNTYESAAKELSSTASGTANVMSRLIRRHGHSDRTRTIAHLITAGLLDTAGLRAALPAELPDLTPREREVLTLLAAHEVRTVARLVSVGQDTIGKVISQAVTAIGARNRTHAVIMVLLLAPQDPAEPGGAR
ncbi:hypothetical protein KV557_00890 [Kitasatospora aureofaciens]|uniref:hypothetical protein n=1 Tax=Kitasatospora aureofaciens TaxID=1894 RepID=UPI001C491B25|nr:hypothetical protein [Kitasatospora aureofaciens]MBV6695679.1 hypothetical protein [Kitasatospora aureofaciens]